MRKGLKGQLLMLGRVRVVGRRCYGASYIHIFAAEQHWNLPIDPNRPATSNQPQLATDPRINEHATDLLAT